MNRPVILFFSTVVLLATACQVHTPNLQPNVELLDTERHQEDEFVALQKPLSDPANPETQKGCPRQDVSPDDTASDQDLQGKDADEQCTDDPARKHRIRATTPPTNRRLP